MYLGLSSQKNDMVVYMLCLYQNQPTREWFENAWNATGKKLKLDISSAGCCLRLKRIEDLSLEVIAATLHRVTIKKYLAAHTAALARIGKGPDGQPLKPQPKRDQAKDSSRPKPGQTSKKRSTKSNV